jgi:tetratricopeptide (TPR) repeat protein
MKVKAWVEKITLPTYLTGEADKNPMFFEKRIYQGSSGVVYPNPVIEKIYDEKVDKDYKAIFIENKYLKIMILPEIGGRVHMAYDKIKERHFIYYNQVIKPALVGLCGPWISGGIEFNWPQHHRPSTFETIDHSIEANEDGSMTVWVNEIDKMFHTKGMAGFTLYEDHAYLEVKAKLYNRSSLPQTFLWWANPAVKVNDWYQSIFPPDVHAVFDHGRRAVSDFPIATGTYYKIDYSPGTDISRYNNIPVPTSYMVAHSEYDFVGGYEHDSRAGFLHVADHHVSPGKKQWTWGTGDFGQAWERNLTDEDGPYVELMIGVYTDNQPDFSWIQPYEEKTFTQYFLPYTELGMVKNATKDILVSVACSNGNIETKVFATSEFTGLTVCLYYQDQLLWKEVVSVSPEKVYEKQVGHAGANEEKIRLTVEDATGRMLISYDPGSHKDRPAPEAAKPALNPSEILDNEQLFLTGHHLEQYRHATYSPLPYYEEALKRDAGDIRCNNALGLWYLRRGRFAISEPYFRAAIDTMTARNPNPYDGEAFYNLGLSLLFQKKPAEAYDAFAKATWNNAWQGQALLEQARLDLIKGHYETALEHINWAVDCNNRNGKAKIVRIQTLRKMGRFAEAIEAALQEIARDQFNMAAFFELYYCYQKSDDNKNAEDALAVFVERSRGTSHNLISYAIDYAAAGLYVEAIELLLFTGKDNLNEPLINYYLGYYWHCAGNQDIAFDYLKKAAKADPAYCFPNRLEDVVVLENAIRLNPSDSKAPYYLANLFYDKRQYDEAIRLWEMAIEKDGLYPTPYRNLAIAYYNKKSDYKKAAIYLEKAYSLDLRDARVLMELDQLHKRLNKLPENRLKLLEDNLSATESRDDLYLERAAIYNFTGNVSKAYQLIMAHQFHPWEGGEGKVSGQYIYSLIGQAKEHLRQNEFSEAINCLQRAQFYPVNLGEGKLPGIQENELYYWMGCAYDGLCDSEQAAANWQIATVGTAVPTDAFFYNDQRPDQIYYQGLAWRSLKEENKAEEIFMGLIAYGKAHEKDEAHIDYFAVSLPDLLIFEDDLTKRNLLHNQYIMALGHLGLGQFAEAEVLFESILLNDSMHFGAGTHLKLLQYFRSGVLSNS